MDAQRPDLIPSLVNGYICPQDPGEPGTGEPRLSVNDHEARLLASLVRGMDVLEIGTGFAVSTQAMAKTAKRVVTIDPDPFIVERVFPTLPANVVPSPYLQDWMVDFDAAFLDGLHTREQANRDIIEMRARVKAHGLLIFHDLYYDEIRQALADSKIAVIHVQTTAGIGLGWNE